MFRIGHLGSTNELMILSALGGAELAMRDVGIPFTSGAGTRRGSGGFLCRNSLSGGETRGGITTHAHRLSGSLHNRPRRQAISRPGFEHEWVDYDRTSPDQVVDRLKGADIAVSNKVPIGREQIEAVP